MRARLPTGTMRVLDPRMPREACRGIAGPLPAAEAPQIGTPGRAPTPLQSTTARMGTRAPATRSAEHWPHPSEIPLVRRNRPPAARIVHAEKEGAAAEAQTFTARYHMVASAMTIAVPSIPMRTMTLVLALLFLPGCVSTADAGRVAIDRASEALIAADTVFGPAYETARVHARETSSSWEERDAKLASWEAGRAALGTAKSAILGANAAMAAAEAGDKSAWFDAAACAADALGSAKAALATAGLSPPALLSRAEAAFRAIGSGRCGHAPLVTLPEPDAGSAP